MLLEAIVATQHRCKFMPFISLFDETILSSRQAARSSGGAHDGGKHVWILLQTFVAERPVISAIDSASRPWSYAMIT